MGTHGIGVNTPRAALVAAATVGFPIELHMPNGNMFKRGMLSIMLAEGILPERTLFFGRTTKELGATPWEHLTIALIITWLGMTGFISKKTKILE